MTSPILRMDYICQKDAQELYGPVENLQEITALIQGTAQANIHGMQNAAGGALGLAWVDARVAFADVIQNDALIRIQMFEFEEKLFVFK